MPLFYADALQNDVELSKLIKLTVLSDPSLHPSRWASITKNIVSILVCLLAFLTDDNVLFHLQLNTIISIEFGQGPKQHITHKAKVVMFIK